MGMTAGKLRGAARLAGLEVTLRVSNAAIDAVLQIVTQGTLTDAHQLGGVLLDAARLFERAADRFALRPFEVA